MILDLFSNVENTIVSVTSHHLATHRRHRRNSYRDYRHLPLIGW
jgi:hypothetical protein